ncbi:helix-turn-helix domain-containing protein [Carbonactinospora thermoautotrophica]|uniref:helix-turn-helix domain-containing protein n=1 Tax=Carbonactinospora thermoautotrophica TaxID=1469144 RepID=UPI000AD611E0
MNRWLRDAPSLNAARRCNVKDELRERARELRLQGWTYPEIAKELNVSKSSVSLWVGPSQARFPVDARAVAGPRQRDVLGAAAPPAGDRAPAGEAAAAREIGALSDRELFLIGAALYWAEGSKLYCRRERVVFINSDPSMMLVFAGWTCSGSRTRIARTGWRSTRRRTSRRPRPSGPISSASSAPGC